MDDRFNIFLQNLTDRRQEKIRETFSPDFLDVRETELTFRVPVVVDGEIELSEQTVVLRLAVETEATLPCAICNGDVQVKIEIPDFYHTEEVANIKNGVYNFQEALREGVLLALPMTAECQGGKCPERKVLMKYLKGDVD